MTTTLTRTTQIGFKLETTEGTPETLSAGDFAGNFKDDKHTLQVGEYDRALKRGSLSEEQKIRTARMESITFTCELVGGGAATETKWQEVLRGMGFKKTQLKVMTLGSVTDGPFVCGTRIGNNATEGSATKTGTAVVQLATSPAKLVYVPGTGAFADTDTVYSYGVSPQVSAPVDSAPSNAGYEFAPMSENSSQTPPSATLERREGGLAHTITAARGKGSLSFRMNEVPLLSAEFQGCPVLEDGNPPAGAEVTSIPVLGGVPLACKGMPIAIAGVTPVLTQIEISLDNTLAMRGTIANNDTQDSGYVGARITGRAVTMTLDPEKDVSGSLEVEAKTVLGTTFPVIIDHGDADHANGRTIVYGAAAQLQGDSTSDDRDGIVTNQLTAKFTGTADDEIRIYSVFVP
ncbi:MAG: hypothetical protein WAZ94_13465 [Phycisphaerales bacterium]